LKNNEQSVNYSPVKKYDAETTPHVKYPPIQRRRKVSALFGKQSGGGTRFKNSTVVPVGFVFRS